MTLFAAVEASPSPAALKDWLEALFYLCGGILACAGVWKLLVGKPGKTEIANDPMSVRQVHDSATKADLEKLEKKVEASDAKHTSSRKGIYGSIEDHGRKISTLETVAQNTTREISDVKSDLKANTAMTSEMRGELKAMNQSFQNLTQSVTHFLQAQAAKK